MVSRVTRVAVFASLATLLLHTVMLPPVPADDTKGKQPDPILKNLEPKPVTLQGKDIRLSTALKALAKQTGNRVEDRRQSKEDTQLKLNLDKATFWQALDTIAREADARVSLYERDGKLALVDGPHQELPTSYGGLFRTAVKRIDTVRFLEPEAHYCEVHLEVAWEPRFQPFLLESRPDALVAQDDKGNTLEVPEDGRGQFAVTSRVATKLELRLPAPNRSALRMGVLKGKLFVVGAGKMLDFTFDELTKLAKAGKRPEPLKRTQEGVTVSLRRFHIEGKGEDQLWEVEVLMEYPGDGPKFESFQSWLVHNEIYLLKEKDGLELRFPNNAGLETGDSTETKAIVTYRFTDEPERKLLLGQPADWKLVYRAPGKMIEVPIPFEFKDLPLP